MAIIECPECRKEVSNKAEACPNCGFGVAKYIERQNTISQIQDEAEREAYLYVKQKRKEKEEREEREKKAKEDFKNDVYYQAIDKYKSDSSAEVEEAEQLFLSISGWKDSDIFLIKCQERIKELRQQEVIKEEIAKKKNRRITVFAVAAFVLAGIVIGWYSYYRVIVVPQGIYDSAVHNIEAGNYEEAIRQLQTIPEHKGASEKIAESRYLEAKRLADNQKYKKALKILELLEGNKDADALKDKCQDAIKYGLALSKFDVKKYEEAVDLLKNNEFDNNAPKLKECYKELACQELSEGEYDNAIKHFELAEYQGEEYQEAYYQKGIEAYEILNYNAAIQCFNRVLNYKDSQEVLLKAETALNQQYDIHATDRELLYGCWYKSLEDGGRVISIDTSEQSRKIWTGWDYNYTVEYVKKNLQWFEERSHGEQDSIVNNGDGTYSMLSLDDSGDKYKLITFKISGDGLEVISVFYDTWKDSVGVYKKVG